MKLELDRVRFKNFFSYGAKFHELKFENGVNLIIGNVSESDRSNGCGKTTLIETIPFALFGKVSKGVRQEQIVNWKNKKDCEVQLDFSIGLDKYTIIRGIKPNILKIEKNGIPEGEFSDKRDYQRWIEDEIIDIDYHTFMSLIYLNMNNYGSILGMKKNIKRDFMNRLFNLLLYSYLNDSANKKINALNNKMIEMKGSISSNEKFIKYHKDTIIELLTKKKNIKSSNEERNEILESLKKEEDKINNLQKEEVREKKTIEKETELVEQSIEDLSEGLIKRNNELSDINGRKSGILSLIDDASLRLKKMKGESKCPLCWSTIDVDKIEEAMDEDNEEREKQLDELDSVASKISEDIKQMKTVIIKKKDQLKSLKKEEKIVDKHYKNIENIEEKIKNIKEKLKWVEKKINNEQEEKKNIDSEIQKHKEEIIKYREKIEKTKTSRNNLHKINDYMEFVKLICRDDAVKQYAISSIVPYVNKQTNYYLSEIGQPFYLQMDKWLNAEIKGPGITEGSYGNLSGGEVKSVDLACQQALLDVAKIQSPIFPSILLYDELLDSSLDGNTIEKLWHIVKLKQEEDKTSVYIVSHRKEISEMEFANIIEVVKEDGFSRIL